MQAGVGMTLINFYRNNGQEKSKRWQKRRKKNPFQNEKDIEWMEIEKWNIKDLHLLEVLPFVCTEFIRGLSIHFITQFALVALVDRILLFIHFLNFLLNVWQQYMLEREGRTEVMNNHRVCFLTSKEFVALLPCVSLSISHQNDAKYFIFFADHWDHLALQAIQRQYKQFSYTPSVELSLMLTLTSRSFES